MPGRSFIDSSILAIFYLMIFLSKKRLLKSYSRKNHPPSMVLISAA
jgi:hypothetical protein